MNHRKLTDEQRAQIRAEYPIAKVEGRVSQLGAKFGVSHETIRHVVKGIGPANQFDPPEVNAISVEHENPDFTVKGTTTLFNSKGEQIIKWVKTERERDPEVIRRMFEAMVEDLPQLPPRRPNLTEYSDDLLSVIPFGDPHIGLHSWAEETGEDFDLKIAERDLCAAVDHLIHTAPPTKECLIANLGDYFHADNMDAETWRSGHKLDVDTRWAKVLRIGIKAMRQCIESALSNHERVTVINAIGNHDDHSSIFLTIALSHIYENEPRVTINHLPRAVHFYEFGKVMLAVTHGHSIKMKDLKDVAADEEGEMWGRTKFRYGLTGHIHHDSSKELRGMKIESFRTLAARDHYAASHGYKSGRDMKAILYHREFGEVARHTVSIQMLAANYGQEK